MAPKTKENPAFPLDFPHALPGPDAPEASVDTGADSLSGEDQAQLDQAAADQAPADEVAVEGALTPKGLADLERILNEVGQRTSHGSVDFHTLKFLDAEGAHIDQGPPATVTLAGITVASQFGLHRALLDWCMAATRKIMAGAQ